jgi:hypothetical protein
MERAGGTTPFSPIASTQDGSTFTKVFHPYHLFYTRSFVLRLFALGARA